MKRSYAAAAFAALAALAVAGCTSHTITTGQAAPPSSAEASASTPSAAPSSSSPASVGDTITLHGNDPGLKMAVTVTKIISHAQPADEFSSPGAGKRFYAVQLKLANTGSAAYSDSPSNGAQVVDSDGQSYDSTFSTVAGCQEFPGTENIAAGETGIGCVVFEVPTGAVIRKIQFTLDSGFAPATGQWTVL